MRPPTIIDAALRRLSRRGDKQKQVGMAYLPLPQRLSAQDTNSYVQPTPAAIPRYMTFWKGNQLPPPTLLNAPFMRYILVSSQDNKVPQRTGGTFGRNLGQLSSTQLVARMHAAWNNRAANIGR